MQMVLARSTQVFGSQLSNGVVVGGAIGLLVGIVYLYFWNKKK